MMKKSEREIKETLPFTIATKRIIYLGINLIKEVKVLYNKNYKTLLKEIEEDTNGKTSHIHESEELILLNCPYYPKPSTDSTQSLSKFQWHSSQEKKKQS